MRILFDNRKLQKACSSAKEMEKAFGKARASKLKQRLAELGVAQSLADLSHLPPTRCHELTGKRKGQFSLDLDHPYRLIIEPDHDPVPLREDGGVDRARVIDIVVLEIVDTH